MANSAEAAALEAFVPYPKPSRDLAGYMAAVQEARRVLDDWTPTELRDLLQSASELAVLCQEMIREKS